MRIEVKGISEYLPEQVIDNDSFRKQHPDWNMGLVVERAGVQRRHIARADETALDLSLEACKKLFSQHAGLHEKIDALIVCTQSPDYIMPPNSSILHKLLDLPDTVFAFDFNLACSGYVYGLALSQGLITAQIVENVLFVTADTYSKYIHPDDRSARVLFGDGAAASWICRSNSSRGVIDILCGTSGKEHDKFMIPAGGCRLPLSDKTRVPSVDENNNTRTLENIHMDGMAVLAFVNSKVPRQIHALLDKNHTSLDDLELIIFHQASKMAMGLPHPNIKSSSRKSI